MGTAKYTPKIGKIRRAQSVDILSEVDGVELLVSFVAFKSGHSKNYK